MSSGGTTSSGGKSGSGGSATGGTMSSGGSAGATGGTTSSGGTAGTSGSGGSATGGTTSSGGTAGATGGTSGSGGSGAGIPASDAFSSATLDGSWVEYDPNSAVLPVVNGGELRLPLLSKALWYNNNDGFALYKLATGDFKVTARVRVFKTSTSTLVPNGFVELAGLMARDPASDGAGVENYVFLVIGSDDGLDTAGTPELAIEAKNTVNGVSKYVNPSWSSGSAELRICRIGSSFTLYRRTVGATTWQPAPTSLSPIGYGYTHALPTTLQVGVVVYSAGNSPDVTAAFDYVDFAGVTSAADCTKD